MPSFCNVDAIAGFKSEGGGPAGSIVCADRKEAKTSGANRSFLISLYLMLLKLLAVTEVIVPAWGHRYSAKSNLAQVSIHHNADLDGSRAPKRGR